MTEAEQRLWYLLRSRRLSALKFRRQYIVEPYIVDFACVEALLVIEVDGGQHSENQRDMIRTAYLQRQGWQVLRFWNNEIMQHTEVVLEELYGHLNYTLTRSALPIGLSHEGEAKI